MMRKSVFLSLLLTLFLLPVVMAQQAAEKGARKAGKAPAAGKILHPEMTPAQGTWAQPAGKLGEKTAQPWSATTIEAAPNGKPNPGQVQTVVGEIVDFSCYLQVGKHGEKHRDCAQKCFRNGQPIGLLTADGSLYMLMEEEHHPRRDGQTNFRDAAIEHAAHVMEVTGTVARVGANKALYVTGYVKK